MSKPSWTRTNWMIWKKSSFITLEKLLNWNFFSNRLSMQPYHHAHFQADGFATSWAPHLAILMHKQMPTNVFSLPLPLVMHLQQSLPVFVHPFGAWRGGGFPSTKTGRTKKGWVWTTTFPCTTWIASQAKSALRMVEGTLEKPPHKRYHLQSDFFWK